MEFDTPLLTTMNVKIEDIIYFKILIFNLKAYQKKKITFKLLKTVEEEKENLERSWFPERLSEMYLAILKTRATSYVWTGRMKDLTHKESQRITLWHY